VPGTHRRGRRPLCFEQLHGEAPERIAQCLDELIRARRTGSIDDQPPMRGIDPCARSATTSERARAQLLQHALLELAHLASTDRETLLLFDDFCAIGCNLPHDG
jgi:hypothetical protein